MAEPVAKVFDEKAAPPPVMGAEEYRLVLEKLLREGLAFGKTASVAAYLLRDLLLETELGDGEGNIKHGVEIEKKYIIMDLTQWPNEYGRSLVMQDIAVQYAKRVVGENEINAPDFKGPGLWSTKQSAFEGDYIRREGNNEYNRRTNIYDPDPLAFRLTLAFNKESVIPVPWGTYNMHDGSTLAVRDKDVPALAAALQSIREGKATTEEALYAVKEDGKKVARFDVYGMEPGFLGDSYKPIEVPENTRKARAALAKAPKTTARKP